VHVVFPKDLRIRQRTQLVIAMPNIITVDRNEHDFQARPPQRTTTNIFVDFIESSISLVEDSCYAVEINRFVPVEDAESHKHTT
jgi:hypothetical protein